MVKQRVKAARDKLVHTVEEDAKKLEKVVQEEATGKVQKVRAQTTEFVDFLREKGVVGLAVGIIIGSGVTALVNSLVSDIVNPLLGVILPSPERLSDATVTIYSSQVRWGSFVAALLNFVVIALVIFLSFKLFKLDKLDKKRTQKQ